MKNSIQICLVLSLLANVASNQIGMEKKIVPANGSEITADTPVKLSSLLYSFMNGKFVAHEDGLLLYDHYSDQKIVYQDTIKEFHIKLLGVHRSMEHIRTGFLLLPIQTKNPFCPILIPKDENEKSQVAMLAFNAYMNNEDLPPCISSEEIKQNRDVLKKAFKAIDEGKDVKEIAARINAARLKQLVHEKTK